MSAPAFVRNWIKADNGGIWLATVCWLLTDGVDKVGFERFVAVYLSFR